MRIRLFPEYSTIFTSQSILYNYLYGGHGVVTLKSPSGVKHTYAYEKPINSQQFPDDVMFVYAIHSVGEGTELQYKKFYLGMIECDQFRMTRNSRFNQDSPIMKGAFYIEKLRKSQQFLSDSHMIIYHQGVCGLCGNKIWSDKSRECGFGSRCRKSFQLTVNNGY